jgi:DNA-binding NarL/FixJ family response regulator
MGDLISALRHLDFHPAVIALDVRLETEQAALAAGADIYVFKGDPPKRLLIAIESIRLRNDYECIPHHFLRGSRGSCLEEVTWP